MPRPEMTPREEKIKEGHNEKRKLERKIIMKKNLLKRITGCFLFVCALASLVATITLGIPATARAAAEGRRVCSVGMLKGLYLWTFDANGNLVAEDKGIIHATRLSVSDY